MDGLGNGGSIGTMTTREEMVVFFDDAKESGR